ncbi:MAG: tetratricopeptide repeat protein [Myxococcota bacterium]
MGLLRPDEIFQLLERSNRQYSVVQDGSLQPRLLSAVLDLPARDPDPVDPFLEVLRDGDGSPRLVRALPPDGVSDAFEAGAEAFSAGRHDEAVSLYEEVVAAAPEYFKAHTYLGRARQFAGRPKAAFDALSEATRLNPLDYQAHLFTADVLEELEDEDGAKRALIRAYALNRTNAVVEDRLRRLLPRLQLRLAEPLLRPRLAVVSTKEAVEIRVGPKGRWAAMGLCLACWAHEPECSNRSNAASDPLRLSMYRECLLNQVAALVAREGELNGEERRLLQAVREGFLESILLWEVLAVRLPALVFLLPSDTRANIEAYIDRHVFASTRLVRGPPVLLDKAGGDFEGLAP